MEFLAVILVAAGVFGACFLIDRGFTKLFRSQAQHKSGLSVRLSKRYASFGLVLAVLGIAAIFTGINENDGWVLPVCGGLVLVGGICLVVYYVTFGIFYDENGFIVTTYKKADKTYTYGQILAQQLYNNQGHTLIELHLSDGNTVHLQSTMTDVYPFLDYAFERWCLQTGRRKEDCPFYDPDNSCWFPNVEE